MSWPCVELGKMEAEAGGGDFDVAELGGCGVLEALGDAGREAQFESNDTGLKTRHYGEEP
jgi:hypothetical protein